MDGTIISQGSFTQATPAVNQTIAIPSGTDWLKLYNYTAIAAGTSAYYGWGYWQLGMGTAGLYQTCAGISAAFAANSFVPYNLNAPTTYAAQAITNINAGTGVVLTGNTTGVAVGSVVRLYNLSVAAAQQWAGIDFNVTAVTANTSFTIPVIPGAAAIGACTGSYIIINTGFFYPRVRTILSITAANPGVVTTTIPHGYQVGETVRFNIPAVTASVFGMTQLSAGATTGVQNSYTITAATSTTFTLNIDTTSFTAFAWPTGLQVPFSPATVTPFGDNTATALAQVPALSSLEDSVQNVSYLGMTLAGLTGTHTLPAGNDGDVIYWVAGKSTLGGS